MSLEKVLEFSFSLFKKDLKIVLPNVLNLIPSALLSLIILQGFNSITTSLFIKSKEMLLKSILFYLSLGIVVFIASILISIFLLCVYCDITRQAVKKKKISLVNAFEVGKSKFFKFLSTSLLAFVIVVLIEILFIPLIFLGAVGLLVIIILIVVTNLIAFVFFFEIPAVVVLEDKEGIEAIRTSYEIGRKKFWSLILALFLVLFISGIVNSALSQIPFIGIIITSIAGLFLNTWIEMLPTTFYFFEFKQMV